MLVRDFGGQPGAPTVVLLHGWTATADLNWFTLLRGRSASTTASSRSTIVATARGHPVEEDVPARGLRRRRRRRRATRSASTGSSPVGYSMGGPIAQLLWRRHPDTRRPASCCARPRPTFSGRREERLGVLGLTGLAAVARHHARPGQGRGSPTSSSCSARRRSGSRGRSERRRATTGGWCSKRARRSARSRRRSGSARSTCRCRT